MNILADFRTQRPANFADAVTALTADGAVPLAAGTDLLPNLRRGLGKPAALVDLSGIEGFGTIALQANGSLRMGAGATLETIAEHTDIRAQWPALAQAAEAVAGPTHRAAATLGGNLCQDTRCIFYNQSAWWREANDYCLKRAGSVCHVAPQGRRCHAAYEGDLAPALLAYDAEVALYGAAGARRMPLAALYRDDGAAHLTLAPGEFVAAVHVPQPAPGTASGYRKVRARSAMDFPLAGVALTLRLDGGAVVALALGLTGTNCHPLRLAGTDALLGRSVDEAWLQALGKLVAKQASPKRSTVSGSHHRRLVAVAAAQRLARELADEARHARPA